MSTLPLGNYMIEYVSQTWPDGWFVSVDDSHNTGIDLCQKDSSKVQVTRSGNLGTWDSYRSFQGVSPKVDGEKFICADNASFYLFYDDKPSMWHVFQLESVTGSQDTFRVKLNFGAAQLYWSTGGGALRMKDDSTSEWKFTKM